MSERLCRGLQILVGGFDSRSCLHLFSYTGGDFVPFSLRLDVFLSTRKITLDRIISKHFQMVKTFPAKALLRRVNELVRSVMLSPLPYETLSLRFTGEKP